MAPSSFKIDAISLEAKLYNTITANEIRPITTLRQWVIGATLSTE
jgi:hypothetical protein